MIIAGAAKPGAIVTDIEGTTSSIAFVHDVLFPYSRTRLATYVANHETEAAPILDRVRAEVGDERLDNAACVRRLLEWHDADRKVGPLKDLQGLIWAEAYASGKLKSHVYPDAVDGLRRWHAAGIPLYIYSSGSVAAQKLLFSHTADGDLTPLFAGYFDTAIGGKKEAASYHTIAAAIGRTPGDILFLSDIVEELDAARQTGFAVMQLVRDGALPNAAIPHATDFTRILPQEALA